MFLQIVIILIFMVSIVIVNFNTFQLTVNCINSVIEQTKAISYEIVLVDNASKECDPEIFLKIFPSINLIKSSQNLGFSKGSNLGIEHSNGDIILLLNSDTVLLNNAIKICASKILSVPDVGAVTARLENLDGTHQCNCQPFPDIKKLFLEKSRIFKCFNKEWTAKFLQGFYWNYNVEGEPDWVWGTFFMFRKKLLAELPDQKLCDEFFMYLEDLKWCWDIRKLKYKVLYEPNARMYHVGGGSKGERKMFVKQNYLEFIDKHYCLLHKLLLKIM